MADNTDAGRTEQALRETKTQYNTQKVARQSNVWSIDPSGPLNRQRLLWRSNGSLFDSTLYTNGDGDIEINLTATGSDTARLKSAFVGRYISHVLSEPGVGISIADANAQLVGNEVSLDHGIVQFGPFFHDGSTGPNAAGVTDGFGIEVNDTEALFFAKAGGSHTGDSPIPQSQWNVSRANGAENTLDLSLSTVFNFAYGYYNALPVTASRVRTLDKPQERRSKQDTLHSEEPQSQPLINTPNLPVQVFVSNEGTASTLDVFVGGMQYSRYGEDDPEYRTTSDYRTTTGGTFTATEAGEPDPAAESGDAFFAYRRQPGQEDLTMRDRQVTIDVTADVFIYFWDEWDAASALDGTFGQPNGAATVGGTDTSGVESLVETQTDCTTYTPTIANFRGARRADAGSKNKIDPTSEDINDRVPQEATRVWTLAIRDGSNSVDIEFLEAEWEEVV